MSKEIITSFWGVPAHITGLFQIVQHNDPLRMGSRGAGFSLARLNATRIICKPADDVSEFKVLFNKKEIEGKVTLAVVESFSKKLKGKSLTIEHYSIYPMQAGFGTSGAGALGTAYALDELLATKKTEQELGQIAHKAEVTCRTGLGDVIAQTNGSAEIRLEPGAPGIGKIRNLEWPIDELILTASFGKISTKEIITDPEMIEKINKHSTELLSELKSNPTVDLFIKSSYEFASRTGLMTGKLKEIILELRKNNFKTSMIMLGESLFVIGSKQELNKCKNLLSKIDPEASIWIDSLATSGPRRLNVKEISFIIGERND